MTTEQTWEKLVLAKVPCPCNGRVGNCGGTCEVCKSGECCGGMGSVPHFPALSKVCWCCNGKGDAGEGSVFGCAQRSCIECHGTGRVLADGVNGGTVIVAIKDTLPVTDIVWKVKEGMWWVRLYNTQGEQVGEAESEDLDQTIYEASVQALEKEKA